MNLNKYLVFEIHYNVNSRRLSVLLTIHLSNTFHTGTCRRSIPKHFPKNNLMQNENANLEMVKLTRNYVLVGNVQTIMRIKYFKMGK